MSVFDNYNRLEIEITSKCNARCPPCSRTDYSAKAQTNPHLTVADLSYENFIKYVPQSAIKNKDLEFCGNFGDPCMHNDLYKILEYCNTAGAKFIILDTNGGAQTKDWWRKIAQTGATVRWGVDGHRKTNSLYRVNTKFDKILENMKAFAEAGGNGIWKYIMFDHNKDEIEIAKQEASNLGFRWLVNPNPPMLLRYKRNNEGELPTLWTSQIKSKKEGKIVTKEVSTMTAMTPELSKTWPKKSTDWSGPQKSIKCELYHEKKLFMDFTGRLWPCCHFGDIANKYSKNHKIWDNVEQQSFDKLQELDNKFGLNWNSILHKSWEEILNHDYYKNILPNTWQVNNDRFQSNYVVSKCYVKCGGRNWNQYIDETSKKIVELVEDK